MDFLSDWCFRVEFCDSFGICNVQLVSEKSWGRWPWRFRSIAAITGKFVLDCWIGWPFDWWCWWWLCWSLFHSGCGWFAVTLLLRVAVLVFGFVARIVLCFRQTRIFDYIGLSVLPWAWGRFSPFGFRWLVSSAFSRGFVRPHRIDCWRVLVILLRIRLSHPLYPLCGWLIFARIVCLAWC